jgi:polysaccharide biosynthesis protein PslH
MARDWDAIAVGHLGMGWVWPAVEAYRRRKPASVFVFIAHRREGEARRTVARNFRGNIVCKIGLNVDAAKADRLDRKLVRQSDLVSAITAEDLRGFGGSDKIVSLTPGYAGLRVACRAINDVAKSHFRATRFFGFVEDLEPIFRSVRIGIVAERTGGGFKNKILDYIFNRVPIAAIKGSMTGLPLKERLHYLSFQSLEELAQGVATVIDDIERLNSLQQAAYEKCDTGFDWSDRGRTLSNAIRQAVNRKCTARATTSAL